MVAMLRIRRCKALCLRFRIDRRTRDSLQAAQKITSLDMASIFDEPARCSSSLCHRIVIYDTVTQPAENGANPVNHPNSILGVYDERVVGSIHLEGVLFFSSIHSTCNSSPILIKLRRTAKALTCLRAFTIPSTPSNCL